MEEAAFFKATARAVYVRAQGHATAAVCPDLKARIFSRLEAEPRIEEIYFDLGPCEYMDSTFLGLIVGTHKRYRAALARPIVLLRANEACRGLLRTIGVLSLVELSDEGPPFPDDMERVSDGARATARFILDAHDDLSGLSEENRARFATLTKVLRGSIDREGDRG